MENSEARQRVLEVAERLFAQRGYRGVTLRDIAIEVGIKHASLYHHVPGGKEQLFVEVTERNLKRHADGLQQAFANAAPDVRSQMRAAAQWLLSQPPMDLIRMVHSDMPELDPAKAKYLTWMAYQSLLIPVEQMLKRASERNEIQHPNFGVVAGGFVGMIESLHSIPDENVSQSRYALAVQLIDILLHGLISRH